MRGGWERVRVPPVRGRGREPLRPMRSHNRVLGFGAMSKKSGGGQVTTNVISMRWLGDLQQHTLSPIYRTGVNRVTHGRCLKTMDAWLTPTFPPRGQPSGGSSRSCVTRMLVTLNGWNYSWMAFGFQRISCMYTWPGSRTRKSYKITGTEVWLVLKVAGMDIPLER